MCHTSAVLLQSHVWVTGKIEVKVKSHCACCSPGQPHCWRGLTHDPPYWGGLVGICFHILLWSVSSRGKLVQIQYMLSDSKQKPNIRLIICSRNHGRTVSNIGQRMAHTITMIVFCCCFLIMASPSLTNAQRKLIHVLLRSDGVAFSKITTRFTKIQHMGYTLLNTILNISVMRATRRLIVTATAPGKFRLYQQLWWDFSLDLIWDYKAFAWGICTSLSAWPWGGLRRAPEMLRTYLPNNAYHADPSQQFIGPCARNIPKCMKEVTWLMLCLSTNGHRSAGLGWLPFI